MAESTNRQFRVGESVVLRVRVSRAGTRIPATPEDGVTLVALVSHEHPLALTQKTAFTAVDEGLYELALDTAAMVPGTYTWTARISSGPGAVSLAEDFFVLSAPALG
jgi:hypothetical protein